jgi:hypothetical protein
MKSNYFIFLILITLIRCVSNEKEKTSITVAELWGAQKYSVASSYSANTQGEKSKTIILSLEDLKDISTDYPKENITSISAYTFIKSLSPEEYKEFDFIKILVNNSAKSYEKAYRISDIIIAQDLFSVVDVFSNKVNSADWEGFSELFDTTVISNAIIFEMKTAIEQIKLANGKQDKNTVVFFDFTKIKKTREAVMICQFEMSNDNSETLYEVMIRVSDKKIISLAIF